MSDSAQIFYLLLLTDADDQGVFEWKPAALKMRLRPASVMPVEPLLEEIVANNKARRFEVGGRHYGAIRNFRKFQRPKFPKAQHPLPSQLEGYVSLPTAITEIGGDDEALLPKPKRTKPAEVPRNVEIAAQMEDGVEKEKKEKEPRADARSTFDLEFDEKFWPAYPTHVDRKDAEKAFRSVRKAGTSLQDILDGLERYRRCKPSFQAWKGPAAWLRGEKWRDETPNLNSLPLTPSANGPAVVVSVGTPEWDAWVNAGHKPGLKDMSSRYGPNGGWSFPTRWPPNHEGVAA